MLSWLDSICLNFKLQNLRSEQDCNKSISRRDLFRHKKKISAASNFNTFDIYHLPLKTPLQPDPCNNMYSLWAWFWRFIIWQCIQFWQNHPSMNFTRMNFTPLRDKHKQNFREKKMMEGYDHTGWSYKQQTNLHIVHDNKKIHTLKINSHTSILICT